MHDFHVIHAPHAGRAALQRLRHGFVEPFLFSPTPERQWMILTPRVLGGAAPECRSCEGAPECDSCSPPTWPSIIAPRHTRTTRASPADNERREACRIQLTRRRRCGCGRDAHAVLCGALVSIFCWTRSAHSLFLCLTAFDANVRCVSPTTRCTLQVEESCKPQCVKALLAYQAWRTNCLCACRQLTPVARPRTALLRSGMPGTHQERHKRGGALHGPVL